MGKFKHIEGIKMISLMMNASLNKRDDMGNFQGDHTPSLEKKEGIIKSRGCYKVFNNGGILLLVTSSRSPHTNKTCLHKI